jgi:hypothetical protein
MFTNNKKIEIYDILNGIKMNYLKAKDPFTALSDVKLTYKTIELKYIKDKNYFIKVVKDKYNKKSDNTGLKSFSPRFSKEETDAYLARKQRREFSPNRPTSPGPNRPTSPGPNRPTSPGPNRPTSPGPRPFVQRQFSKEETDAYLARKQRREFSPNRSASPGPNRSASPGPRPFVQRQFTKEETDAYLARKKRREEMGIPEKIGGFYIYA